MEVYHLVLINFSTALIAGLLDLQSGEMHQSCQPASGGPELLSSSLNGGISCAGRGDIQRIRR